MGLVVKRFNVSVLALVASLVVLSAESALVETAQGSFRGERDKGISRFKGLPYARPPLGELRWQAPQPPDKHEGVRPALAYGAACMQPSSARFSPEAMSEDCLSLNVWTADTAAKHKPVMVWIHGGGFRSGSGQVPGEVFATRGAVFVSLNYRLGPLGFLSHPALGNSPANFALLDIQAALAWVQDNIAAFGGDPKQVTVFGVSAGGMAVNMLMSSPTSKGLFQRAIAQSGYGTWPLPRAVAAGDRAPLGLTLQAPESAETLGQAIIAKAGDGKSAQTRDYLYGLLASDLVAALDGFQLPIVDGLTLLEEPGILFQRGEQLAVPYLSGGNSFEGSVMAAAGFTPASFSQVLGEQQAQARHLYRNTGDALWLQRLFGDYRYLLSARVLAASMQKVQQPAWLYYIDYVPGAAEGHPGAFHASDSLYLFYGSRSKDSRARSVSAELRDYWLRFAQTGNPNGVGLLDWPEYAASSRTWLQYSAAGTSAVPGLMNAKLRFLEAQYTARIASGSQ